jgi:hypothetical protein
MDPVSLIAIISASSALVVAILTHIKYSKCCGFVLRTTEGNETPTLSRPPTPIFEKQQLLQPLLKSDPISIINPPKIKNYL